MSAGSFMGANELAGKGVWTGPSSGLDSDNYQLPKRIAVHEIAIELRGMATGKLFSRTELIDLHAIDPEIPPEGVAGKPFDFTHDKISQSLRTGCHAGVLQDSDPLTGIIIQFLSSRGTTTMVLEIKYYSKLHPTGALLHRENVMPNCHIIIYYKSKNGDWMPLAGQQYR